MTHSNNLHATVTADKLLQQHPTQFPTHQSGSLIQNIICVGKGCWADGGGSVWKSQATLNQQLILTRLPYLLQVLCNRRHFCYGAIISRTLGGWVKRDPLGHRHGSNKIPCRAINYSTCGPTTSIYMSATAAETLLRWSWWVSDRLSQSSCYSAPLHGWPRTAL